MSCCPTCGRPIDEKFLFDFATGDVVAGDRRVHLTPTEAAVFGTLHKARGRLVCKEVLENVLFGELMDVETDNNLRVHVSRLRKKLRGMPIHIATNHGRGYQLETVQ